MLFYFIYLFIVQCESIIIIKHWFVLFEPKYKYYNIFDLYFCVNFECLEHINGILVLVFHIKKIMRS